MLLRQPCDDSSTIQEPEKLRARAERFGAAKPEQTGATTAPAVGRKKRGTAVVEEVDLEEQERRRKRAERFGNPVVVRSKSSCPIFASVDQLNIGREGLIPSFRASPYSYLFTFCYFLWIRGIDSVPCLDMPMARVSVIYPKLTL
jgi:hypothetical protein